MDRIGFVILNAVFKTAQKLNILAMDKKTNSELHCHCSIPVFCTSRTNPLAACQLLCGNYQKVNTAKCHFSITLKPINFLETIPALFVYEVEETGKVFTSLYRNPVKVVMELQGLLPTKSHQIRIDTLFVDEPSLQDYYEHLRKVDYFNLQVLLLNTINQIVTEEFTDHFQTSWPERINEYFHHACTELTNHIQLTTWKKQYSLLFIKQSLLDFVICQV